MALLNDLAQEIYANNVEKGWRGDNAPDRSVGDELALIHSEVSEALEAYREHGHTELWYDDNRKNANGMPKPEGVASEMADVIIRVLDFCEEHKIDIEEALTVKMAYNSGRSFRHGGKVL